MHSSTSSSSSSSVGYWLRPRQHPMSQVRVLFQVNHPLELQLFFAEKEVLGWVKALETASVIRPPLTLSKCLLFLSQLSDLCHSRCLYCETPYSGQIVAIATAGSSTSLVRDCCDCGLQQSVLPQTPRLLATLPCAGSCGGRAHLQQLSFICRSCWCSGARDSDEEDELTWFWQSIRSDCSRWRFCWQLQCQSATCRPTCIHVGSRDLHRKLLKVATRTSLLTATSCTSPNNESDSDYDYSSSSSADGY